MNGCPNCGEKLELLSDCMVCPKCLTEWTHERLKSDFYKPSTMFEKAKSEVRR